MWVEKVRALEQSYLEKPHTSPAGQALLRIVFAVLTGIARLFDRCAAAWDWKKKPSEKSDEDLTYVPGRITEQLQKLGGPVPPRPENAKKHGSFSKHWEKLKGSEVNQEKID